MFSGQWTKGRPRPTVKDNEPKCESCNGRGSCMEKHQFIGGWSYVPCYKCGGSGAAAD